MTTTPSTSLYPIRFEAQNIPRIWGADHLGAPRNGVPIGERWLLSPLPSKETLVANGELAGMTPSQLVVRYGASLLGKRGSWADLPLVKWIDSAHPLSFQVHPNDLLARQLGEPHGKSEMWYILDAAPDAKIYVDTPAPLSLTDLKQVVADGALEQTLTVYHPTPGELYYVPGGVLHAIGGGIQLIEIQQPSDTTYRLYDWERTDANGLSRPLQLDLAYRAYDPKARAKVVAATKGAGLLPIGFHEPPFSFTSYLLASNETHGVTYHTTAHIYLASRPIRLRWTSPLGAEQEESLPAMTPVLLPAVIASYSFCAEQPQTLLLEFMLCG